MEKIFDYIGLTDWTPFVTCKYSPSRFRLCNFAGCRRIYIGVSTKVDTHAAFMRTSISRLSHREPNVI